MLLPLSFATAPNSIGGGHQGAVTAVCEDDVDGSLNLETPAELSMAHARLTLLENAIRATISNAIPGNSSTPSHVHLSESKCVTNASDALPNSPPLKPPQAEMGTPSNIMETPTGASERLHLLQDNLRRIRKLMQQYEESSQRMIKVYLVHSSETGELVLGPVSVPSEDAAKGQKKRNSNGNGNGNNHAPQDSLDSASTAATANAAASGNGRRAVEEQKTTPSLHQRRALASDSAFSAFCGLHITPDQLLLPLTALAHPVGSATPPTGERTHNKPADQENLTNPVADCRPSRGTANSSQKRQAAASGDSKSLHSSAAAGAKGTQPSGTAQSLHRTSTEASMKIYADFFLKPPVASAFSPNKARSEVTESQSSITLTSAPGAASPPAPTAAAEVVRSLQELQQQIATLQRCRLFSYEAQVKAAAADSQADGESSGSYTNGARVTDGGAAFSKPIMDSVHGDMSSWQHIHVAIQNMQNSLDALQTRWTRESSFACCGDRPIALTRQLQSLTELLIRQLKEMLSKPVVEEVGEISREKLRRMKFDVKEMQQAQTEAIANGDMQHSEELYYEQTSLAESMAGPYDDLEAKMKEYGETCINAPLTSLLTQRDVLQTWLAGVIEEHAKQLSHVMRDADRVKEKVRAVAQARHKQRDILSTYHHNWKKEWQSNSDKQLECYRAMEQLEKQLMNLQKVQRHLVDDWIHRVSQERQREEDAAAFSCFADARSAALAEMQRNLQAVVEGLRQYSRGMNFSCGRVEAFAHEVLHGHLSQSQLALRKDRLEEFRTLYLTLGDLRFKKSRNAEEIQKKVDYYTLQQEVAMDVLNPKAKEFSRAKHRWESAKAESLAQIDELDQRSRTQLEAFRPTEKLLRQSGFNFISPEEELARRMQQRSQKLLEYQQQIEECMGVQPTNTLAATATADPASRRSHAKSFSGTDPPLAPPPRLQAIESRQPSPPPVGRGRDTNGQLPPIRSINRTYPPPQHTDHDGDDRDKTVAMTVASSASASRGVVTTSASTTVSSTAPLASLHSTEERIMQDVSKTAMMSGGRRTNYSTAFSKFKTKK